MKKFLVILAVMAILPAASAVANPIIDPVSVGGTIQFANGPGGGRGGSFIATLAGGYTFPTFCVELTEHISLGSTTYYIGGIGTHTVFTNVALTEATAWAYQNYRYDTLSGHGLGLNAEDFNSTVQAFLWSRMGLLAWGGYAGNYSQALLNFWAADFLASGWTGVGDVRILNIFTSTQYNEDHAAQDQLALVPEPGSMLLLGTGLIGLAGAVRRWMRKK